MKLLAIAWDAADAQAVAGFAQSFGAPFDLLLLTGQAPEVGAQSVFLAGLEEVPPADTLAESLPPYLAGYSHVAAVSAMRSKDVLARLAGLLDCPLVTDVLKVEAPNRFVRPMVAGSILATVEVSGQPTLMTVRPAGFPKANQASNGPSQNISLDKAGRTVRTGVSESKGGRPDLTQARVIVSGGRPLKDAETFERVLGGLADQLGGAVGATRAAVDSGIASNELQVGQTGKIVAPDLYIAAGISGSTQHMAGMKDSKVIVAINTDGDAAIFDIADLGIVGDLYVIIPELQTRLKK